MIKVFLKDGRTIECKGADSAEVEPERTYAPMLVIKENSLSPSSEASFVLSEVLGYSWEPDPEKEE